MPKRFDIRSRFEVEGVFWATSNPDEKFSGHLSATEKGIELSTAPEISRPGPEQFFAGSKTKKMPEVIHGWTSLDICTLIDLHELPGPQHINPKTGEVLASRQFRVSLCIIGMHLADASALLSGAIDCTYSGMESWLSPTSKVKISEEEVSVRYPRKSFHLLDLCVLTDKMRITLSVGSDLELSSSGRHSAANRPRITIAPTEPTSLEKFLDTAYRFEDFLSLFHGISVRLWSVHFEMSDGQKGWLVRRERARAEKPDIQARFQCEPWQLSAAIATWFTTTEELRPLQNFIYGTVRDTSMSVETEFLSLAQALESFHRLTDRSTIVETCSFEQISSAIIRTIEAVCDNSVLAKKLKETIQFANEPSFGNRIESLIGRVRPEHALLLLGDPIEFEQTLRQTRNFLTHLGIKKQSKVLTSGSDLFLFNQKLHAFLRLLMLLDVGFSADLVFESVRYQSRKWILF